MLWNQITNGAGSTNPQNYFYFRHADGDREACQLACEQEPGCHAYSLHTPDHGNGWANMCYGISEAKTTRNPKSQVNSGYKVNCGNQTGKINI